MKKIMALSIFSILLTGCASNIDNRAFWHNVGENNVFICEDLNTSISMVKFANSERSLAGQALKARKMIKSEECKIVKIYEITKTGQVHTFDLTEEFPESFRGVKKQIEQIRYSNQSYWLIPTKNK